MHDIGSTQTELPLGPDPELDGLELGAYGEVDAASSAIDALEDPSFELGEDHELTGASEDETGLSEDEVEELAYELLGVSSEDELDQFLGNVFKKAWRGVKTVARAAAPHVGRFVKGIAKKALPTVAGALGTFVGGPVGGAIGGKLGAAAANLLEVDLQGLNAEEAEAEVARRVVRVAASSARRAARTSPRVHPRTAARSAVVRATTAHLPGLLGHRRRRHRRHHGHRPGVAPGVAGASVASATVGEPAAGTTGNAYQDGDPLHPGDEDRGQWVRRGSRIILYGVD